MNVAPVRPVSPVLPQAAVPKTAAPSKPAPVSKDTVSISAAAQQPAKTGDVDHDGDSR